MKSSLSHKPANVVRYDSRRGLQGRVPKHVKNLNSALGQAVPPKRGDEGFHHYKRMITGLIGDLHFHLSELD